MQILSCSPPTRVERFIPSLKLFAGRGLTDRSTGHFAAVQVWAINSSPNSVHRKVPVSSNVRPHNQLSSLPSRLNP